MAEQFAPCPFCGEEELLDVEHELFHAVRCDKCDACGPPANERDEAIEFWNYRPGELDLHQQICSMDLANIGNEFIEAVDDGEKP